MENLTAFLVAILNDVRIGNRLLTSWADHKMQPIFYVRLRSLRTYHLQFAAGAIGYHLLAYHHYFSCFCLFSRLSAIISLPSGVLTSITNPNACRLFQLPTVIQTTWNSSTRLSMALTR